jgi:hypothetical protein
VATAGAAMALRARWLVFVDPGLASLARVR